MYRRSFVQTADDVLQVGYNEDAVGAVELSDVPRVYGAADSTQRALHLWTVLRIHRRRHHHH